MTKDISKTRLGGLDFLRAVAITIVFFWHYRQSGSPQWIDSIGLFGWTGVDLFFLLSGYLIGAQLLNRIINTNHISFRDFYLRRFFRIIPAFLTVLVLYFTVPLFREKPTISPLWKFLTFTQNFGLDFRTHGAFSHSWSLCIEEQFYLVLPVLIMIMFSLKPGKKTIYLFLAFVFTFGFATRIYSWLHFINPLSEKNDISVIYANYFEWVYYPTYNRLDGLLIGICIAAMFQLLPKLTNKVTQYGNVILLSGMALIACAYFLCADLASFNASVFGFPLVSIAYGLIVIAALSPSSILYKFDFRVSGFIATLSYAIYLTHKQLIHLTRFSLTNYTIGNDSNTMFFICVAVSILGGLLLHLIVERPFLKLRDKLLKKNKIELPTPLAEKIVLTGTDSAS